MKTQSWISNKSLALFLCYDCHKKNHTFQYGYETTKLSFEEGCCLLKNSLDIIRPIDLMLDYTEITITEWFAAYKEYLKQSKKMINAY